MFKNKFRFSVLFFLILSLLGCTGRRVPEDVKKTYIDFLEISKIDLSTAVNTFCYFKYDEERELAAESTDYLLSYHIEKWEQISDVLWAVTVEIKTAETPNGKQYTHFVGLMNNRYWIMTSTARVPDELKDTENFEKYLPTGNVVSFEDLIR